MLVLVLSTWAIVPLLRLDARADQDPSLGGDPLAGAIWALLYALTGLLLLRVPGHRLRFAAHGKLVWSLLLLALVSTLWSAAPDVSLKRGIGLIGAYLFGAYLGTRYQISEWMRLVLISLAICMLGSVAVGLLLPEYGTYVDPDLMRTVWQGLYPGRNALGRIASYAGVVFALYALEPGPRRLRLAAVGLTLISIVLLLVSDSRTGLVTLIVLLALVPAFRASKSWAAALGLAIPFAGAIALVTIPDLTDAVLNLLNRDATLTGRIQLWGILWPLIGDHVWLGYGYSAFWLGWDGPSAVVWAQTDWFPPSAHNGFMDLWLGMGVGGVALLAAAFVQAVWRTLALPPRTYTLERSLLLASFSFLILSNLTETTLLSYNFLSWILFVATCIGLSWTRSNRGADAS
ncbi:MAG: O-antigen ligase family protein [Chloroflexi bacterium]|nr:O-antigen ligase family protein [Chloroflexota bacterium]